MCIPGRETLGTSTLHNQDAGSGRTPELPDYLIYIYIYMLLQYIHVICIRVYIYIYIYTHT